MGGLIVGRGEDGLAGIRIGGGEGLGWIGAVGEDEGGVDMPPGTGLTSRGNRSKEGTPPLPPGNMPPDNGAIGDVLDTMEGSENKIGEVEGRVVA